MERSSSAARCASRGNCNRTGRDGAVLGYAEDHTGQIVADSEQLAAAGVDEMTTAGNLFTDRAGSQAWKPYAPRDRAGHYYRLDIAKALTIPVTAFTPVDDNTHTHRPA